MQGVASGSGDTSYDGNKFPSPERTMTATQSFDGSALQSQLQTELAGIDLISEPAQVRKLSQDYSNFSPILSPKLAEKTGDLVARPTHEAEVIRVVAACFKHGIPITERGAGTGNYGQCVPMQGGVVLDMSRMNQVKWVRPGMARVEAGAKLAAIDKQTRDQGWEIRMAPSTYRTATIGGFIGGGSCGMGSINFGMLSDRGNLQAVRIVTMEADPQVIELRGDLVQKVNHAYGTTGIITELEIPLAPAYAWAERIVCFDQFMDAARFGQTLADADGVAKKLISVFADPIPGYFTALKSVIPAGTAAVFVMVAESSVEAFDGFVEASGGSVAYAKSAAEASKATPLLEYTWNHTTLHARNVDASLTYLQTIFPRDPSLALVETMYEKFGDEVMIHLEFLRQGGAAIPGALQLVRYTTEERLNEIIQIHREAGCFIPNPHEYTVEDGGSGQVDPAKVAFKAKVDPQGLLNPEKLRGWEERN